MTSAAEAEVRRRIARRGKIPFAEFMELALYHPQDGYYAGGSSRTAEGDYYTSPGIHPAFGALLCVQIHVMWEVLGRPARFHVVEAGAGGGLLAKDVVDSAPRLSRAFAAALRYVALERGFRPTLPEASTAGAQRVMAQGVPLRGVVGCLISNELVDSFPVHRFQLCRRALTEVYVRLDGEGRLTEVLDEPSTPGLADRIADLDLSLPEGFQGEVNLNVGPWMRQVSRALERGFVITIDYGYPAEVLYSSERAGGTLQTYYRHTDGSSPYQRIGEQDITAHVDFSLVGSEGAKVGLRPLALVSQAEFLHSLGFQQMLDWLRQTRLGGRERDANSMAMLELVKAGGLGDFKVLIQEKGTGVADAAELAAAHGWPADLPAPLLDEHRLRLMEARYPHAALDFDKLWPWGSAPE